ncbi:MAG: hypothetical protein WC806_03480 [Candidatus Gracilibacteria bacterium]|jgi:hypothetical protein
MDNEDKYFKGQQKTEEFICFFRKHWVVLVNEFIYFLIFTVLIVATIFNIELIKRILVDNEGLKIFFIMGFLLSTIYIHRFFIKMFNHFSEVGIITDIRLIDHQKTLFFRDTMEAIDMLNVQDIEQRGEGFLPNILGYGDIKLYLNATSSVKIFYRVPNAKFHFRCISRQKQIRQMLTRDHSGLNKDFSYENYDILEQQQCILDELNK